MMTFNATTIILLSGIAFNAITSLHVIGMVLRPLLTTAIAGLINLARQALDVDRIHADALAKVGRQYI